jgi:hypothetical protein
MCVAPEVLRTAGGAVEQRSLGFEGVRQDAAIVDEGHGDQEATEEPAGEEDQRQYSTDLILPVPRHQVDGPVPEGLFHDPLPAIS